MHPIRLGLCVPRGKKLRMGLPHRIKITCEQANIQVIDVNMDEDLELQGPFDFILHKILDLYNEHNANIEDIGKKIDQFSTFIKRHPEIVVVDNLEYCWKLTNRKYMITLIEKCTFSFQDKSVYLPKTMDVLEKCSFNNIKSEMNGRHFRFPVVVKPHSAYFDDGAHVMSLVFNMDGLKKIKKPCLVQEFCNHNGVCYKVFVIGDRYHICQRPSIKDMNESGHEDTSSNTISFDSFKVSKTGQPFCLDLHNSDPSKQDWISSDENPNLLDRNLVEGIISKMRKVSGLLMYGFDILVEKDSKNYALIDINQFPSYKGIAESHFANDFVALLQSLKSK